MRKDPNYLLAKTNASEMGGKLINVFEDKIVCLQLTLPIDKEVIDSMRDPECSDRSMWKGRNRAIFSQIHDVFIERLPTICRMSFHVEERSSRSNTPKMVLNRSSRELANKIKSRRGLTASRVIKPRSKDVIHEK